MRVLLESLKAARLEQVWEKAIFLPNWCKIVPEWPMTRTLHPHLTFLHSLTVYDTCTCYAWLELAKGQVCGRQSKLATLGWGSNGGTNSA